MATKNDKVILDLKKEIQKKKSSLAKETKFTPITNCSLELDGSRFNLHVVNKETLLLLIAKLTSLKTAISIAMPEEKLMISGYDAEDWLTDLTSKFKVLNISNEKERLQKLETKLHNLLSTDTKVELEIEELKDMI